MADVTRSRPAALPVPDALATYAIALLLMVAVGPALAPLGSWRIGVVQLGAVAAPAVVVAALRTRALRGGLGLRAPTGRALAGAALVGASFWYLNMRLVVPVASRVFGDDVTVRHLEEIVRQPAMPLWTKLALLAAIPAVCEELLFRGALTRSLRPAVGVAAAVGIQAVLFALFHLSPSRLLPTLTFGLALGGVALAAGSTAASIVTHFLNNAAAIALGSEAGAPVLAALEAHPGAADAGATALCAGGALLLWAGRRPPRTPERGGGRGDPAPDPPP